MRIAAIESDILVGYWEDGKLIVHSGCSHGYSGGNKIVNDDQFKTQNTFHGEGINLAKERTTWFVDVWDSFSICMMSPIRLMREKLGDTK